MRDMPSADVLEVALCVHIKVIGDGEPEVFLSTPEPVLEDQARDSAAFTHAGCGGREGGREGGRKSEW